MENFKKLVYINPEFQKSEKKEEDFELVEKSKEVAQGKLDRIMDPNFGEYCVRMMNLGEYAQIIKNKEIKSGETFLVNLPESKNKRPFVDYLKSGFTGPLRSGQTNLPSLDGYKINWANEANNQTNWSHSSHNISQFKDLIAEIKDIRSKESAKDKDENYVKDILNKFRDKIIKNRPWNNRGSIVDFVQNEEDFNEGLSFAKRDIEKYFNEGEVNAILSELESRSNSSFKDEHAVFLLEKLEFFEKKIEKLDPDIALDVNRAVEYLNYRFSQRKAFGIENIKIVKKFLKDKQFLSRNKDNLRKLISALSYQGIVGGAEFQQYHVALIMSSEITKNQAGRSTYSWHDESWPIIQPQPDKGAGFILGVISLMPNKELYKEIIDLEKDSGDFAHPVFDSSGNIRWPK